MQRVGYQQKLPKMTRNRSLLLLFGTKRSKRWTCPKEVKQVLYPKKFRLQLLSHLRKQKKTTDFQSRLRCPKDWSRYLQAPLTLLDVAMPSCHPNKQNSYSPNSQNLTGVLVLDSTVLVDQQTHFWSTCWQAKLRHCRIGRATDSASLPLVPSWRMWAVIDKSSPQKVPEYRKG